MQWYSQSRVLPLLSVSMAFILTLALAQPAVAETPPDALPGRVVPLDPGPLTRNQVCMMFGWFRCDLWLPLAPDGSFSVPFSLPPAPPPGEPGSHLFGGFFVRYDDPYHTNSNYNNLFRYQEYDCYAGAGGWACTFSPPLPVEVRAQSAYGNLEGTVRDGNGQSVEGAVVERASTRIGPERATTNAAGYFRYPVFDPAYPMFGYKFPFDWNAPSALEYEVRVISMPTGGPLPPPQRVMVSRGVLTHVDFGPTAPPEDRPKEVAQGPQECISQVGRPINVTTGNMYTQQEDLAYPSAFARFAFTRTYNSQSTYNGPLGLGWTHPFDFELKELRPGVIRVRNGAGNVRFYELVTGSPDTYQVAAPARDTSTLVKNTGGFTETEKDGLRRLYDTQGRLLSITTRAGWTTTLTYSSGRLSTVTDPGGRTLTFTYTDGRLTRVDGPGGLFAQYVYDSQGRLVTVTDGMGTRWTYTYSDATPSRLTSVQDANGHLVEEHTYDGSGQVIATTGAEGVKALTLAYLDGSHTRVTDSLGRVTAYTFGVFGDLPLITQIEGPCPCGTPDSTFTYDAQGRRLTQTDARGNTTAFEYDAQGNLTKRTDPLGQATAFTYNAFGQVLTTTDPTGATTTFSYDGTTGFLLQVTDALGHTTTLAPDAHNLPGAITNPRGHTTAFSYADTGLLSAITDPTGATRTFAYDDAGRLRTATDALRGSTAYTYDARGKLLTVTDPVGALSQFAYDPAGNRVVLTDPNGRQTTYSYDAANRLTAVTDPAQGTTAYAYDSERNLLSLTDAKGQTTTFAYDNHNRLARRTDSLGKSETFTYDAVGNLTARTDRKGQTIGYAYDALNRLTEKALPDGATAAYACDPLGRLLGATDPNGSLSFTYDSLGRVLTTTSQDSRALTYTYDSVGNRLGLQDETGSLTSYAYDPRDLLMAISDPRSGSFSFQYDALGRRTTLTRPNGTGTTYTYDPASRLTTLGHGGPKGPFEALSYAYDLASNRTADTRNRAAQQYAYDPLDQLTQVQRQENRSRWKLEEAYTYDPAGNRLTGPEKQTSTYDAANRLTTDGKYAYSYDANGNLVEKRNLDDGAVTTYTYDAEDRLIRVVTPKAEVTFQYDPLGRRSEKHVVRWEDEDGDREPDEEGSPRVIHYLYDQEDILATFDDSGRELARYTHGPGIDEPLAEVRRYTTRFYHADVLGSIIALSEKHGQSIRHYRYSAFGTPEDHKGDSQPYRFTGREWDKETGLYYYRARYYAPRMGRFLAEDPTGLLGDSTNLYPYAASNPTRWADPFGEAQWHTDYSSTGEKLLHYGKYRFNQYGELVEHTGKVIGEATGAALRALKYLKNVKPDFFKAPMPLIIIDPCIIMPELCAPCGPPA